MCNTTELDTVRQSVHRESKGGYCPACGSPEIEADSVEFGSGEVFQKTTCITCHSTWQDVYALDRFIDLDDQKAALALDALSVLSKLMVLIRQAADLSWDEFQHTNECAQAIELLGRASKVKP